MCITPYIFSIYNIYRKKNLTLFSYLKYSLLVLSVKKSAYIPYFFDLKKKILHVHNYTFHTYYSFFFSF